MYHCGQALAVGTSDLNTLATVPGATPGLAGESSAEESGRESVSRERAGATVDVPTVEAGLAFGGGANGCTALVNS